MADVETLIVGGGISGMCMAIQLLKAGRTSFAVLEKSGDIGGAWSVNKYPGCACDVPSHVYSFSFDRNPSWSSMFADRHEIHEYLKCCAQRHGVHHHFRFHSLAREAAWDETAALWRVQVQDAEASYTLSAKFLVHAIGSLHVPKLPSIKGMECFAGHAFHSSSWDSNVVDLQGKKVAIIGTGASAIQIVPMIAPLVEKLYVCQRTAPWILPKANFTIAKTWHFLFRIAPLLMRVFSFFLYLVFELLGFISRGGCLGTRHLGQWIATQHMKFYIKDKKMRSLLVPKYAMGCKRILLSSTFYRALSRSNVELLVDPILEITEHTMLLGGESRESQASLLSKKEIGINAVIYATGFDAFSSHFEVTGTLGQSLHHAGPSSMLGITKQGFPNFFMLLGPNTTLGHNSLIIMVEAQVRYIIDCMKLVLPFVCSMELCHASELRYQNMLAHRLANSIWHSGACSSWYFDPTTGQNNIIWPASSFNYRYHARYVNPLDYSFK